MNFWGGSKNQRQFRNPVITVNNSNQRNHNNDSYV
jgi:hypothetical protein